MVLFLHAQLIVLTGCGTSHEERRSPETAFIGINHPVQESWAAKLAITESGMTTGVIEAAHGAIYKTDTGDEHHLDGGIKVTFFDVNGRSTTSITAANAVIHDNQDIEAYGNVVITSNETTVVRTEYIRRSAKDNMIRSDKFVTITRPEETIRGYGFESDQNLKKYRIFRGSGETFIKQ
ncbi:MAG: LPS export ABC transporter periplasmic protein LptC [Chlorobiaceae bacterium]|nr:LPS export ABC transporter periplasmic protein LptC [Chlorobiaceae bacterium]